MPKLTVLVGRKTMQVYDLDQDRILVGRGEDADVLIDNPSLSRKHCEFRKEGDGWVLEDLGSSNGTFLHGEKLTGPTPIKSGDEVGLGKFSVVFGKAVGGEAVPKAAKTVLPGGGVEGTMQIKGHEVKELLEGAERERRAHLVWSSGGQQGKHYLSAAPAALFGTDELCDVKVPKAPKHHVLVVNRDTGCEVRNLHWWTKMTVNGQKKNLALLKDGAKVECGGLILTFVADLG
ncbi:MAG: FHA domain-containing protein [Longimicrobiales bacterium]